MCMVRQRRSDVKRSALGKQLPIRMLQTKLNQASEHLPFVTATLILHRGLLHTGVHTL